MLRPLKAVIDTNIFISAYLGSANCLGILDAFKKNRFILTAPLKNEIRTVLKRPELTGLSDREVDIFFKINEPNTMTVETITSITICRDPQDNKILEAAAAARADIIVTGDKDLLTLNSFHVIPIVTPKEFLKRLKMA